MIKDIFLLNLQNLINSTGLDQSGFAESIGLPQSTVNGWFRRRTIPTDQLDLLAKHFNVEPYYFFMKPGSQGEAKPTSRQDNFTELMDELALKHLSADDLESYREAGGARAYVEFLRLNYENDDAAHLSDWFWNLNGELLKYTSLTLRDKLAKRIELEASKMLKKG